MFSIVYMSCHFYPVAGVGNLKNLLLMNQKIYVHDGWVFVCYQYRGILYCNALPAFSLRDASCNVIDIEITCRTFGCVIVALFPTCTFADEKCWSSSSLLYISQYSCGIHCVMVMFYQPSCNLFFKNKLITEMK